MPFRRITKGRNKGKYRSPRGRVYTPKQVRAYYATGGFSRKPRRRKRR
jgi:hypothetical protein